MCAYKLVTVKFKWWGLQTRVENLIHDVRRILTRPQNNNAELNVQRSISLVHENVFSVLLRRHESTCFASPQQEKRIFTNFHRQLFCTIDRWVDLTMDDIRKMEAETQRELEEVSVSHAKRFLMGDVTPTVWACPDLLQSPWTPPAPSYCAARV